MQSRVFKTMRRNKNDKKLSLAVSLVSISLASEAQRLEEITVIGVVPAGSSIDAAKLAYPIQTASADDLDNASILIKEELKERLIYFSKANKLLDLKRKDLISSKANSSADTNMLDSKENFAKKKPNQNKTLKSTPTFLTSRNIKIYKLEKPNPSCLMPRKY